MSASVTTLPADVELADVIAVLEQDGGVIVRGLLDPGVIERFRGDIVAEVDEHRPGATTGGERTVEFWGSQTKRFTRLGWRSPAFEDILMAPTLRSVADSQLLPSCDDYWLNTGQMMIIGPGESEQMQHRDAGNWRAMCTPTSPEVTVSCMYALGDFTGAHGATRLVPGSHLWDDYDRVAAPEEFAVAEMAPGDGLIYSGRVIHNGGANATADSWRLGLHVSFVLGWLTPEEALPISVPWSAAKEMSDRAQRLLGWKSYGTRSRLWTVDYEEISVALDVETPTSER